MATTVEDLIPFIYHERQQPGSMLCAQHALNSLLQGPYFTAPDLSEIARKLDALEQGYDDDNRGESTNMDDTGFFSVQVMEDALQVWGLTLVRWRSEAMRPFQDHPHTQLAFVLNQHEHWYTLRRFGPALPNAAEDPGDGHWFNLNSSLERPEWVGKLYLGMFLQEAEAQGYSVFTVVQRDPSAELALARTQADEIAMAVAEPSVRDRSRLPQAGASASQTAVEGFEDEDMELQAALQASLMGGGGDYGAYSAGADHSYPAPVTAASADPIFSAGSGRDTPVQRRGYGALVQDDDEELDEEEGMPGLSVPMSMTADPIAASRVRNEAFMEMMRRQQEAALRETYDADAVGRQRNARAEQEDAELLRAIEESRRLHEELGDAPPRESAEQAPAPPPQDTFGHDRVYDDEDAELQAALSASLETVPEGFRLPSTPPRAPAPALPASHPPPAQVREEPSVPEDEFETESEAETTSSVVEPEPQLSMEEIRRRRLAKFGG